MTRPEERRSSILTDDDFSRIERIFDSRIQRLFETIGYDTSTPESRAAIYADHRFVRGLRKARGLVITGIGSAVSMIFYIGVQWFLKMRGPS